jgi:hypothetical protein
MSSTSDKILALARQFYPTGRAFKMPAASELEKLHLAIGGPKTKAYQDAVSILNALLPDNDKFTDLDAEDWERRLGMISNPLVLLADRKLAILRKMSAPGRNPAKGAAKYIEFQLRAAGFDVYVHENIPVQNPIDVFVIDGFGELDEYELDEVELGSADTYFQDLYTDGIELDEVELDEAELSEMYFKNKVVNHIEEEKDFVFNVGDFSSIIFIGGQTKGIWATVDINRKTEFRQLILKLKHTHIVAYLLINYI